MFDEQFFEAVRNKKHHRVDYPDTIKYSWDRFIPFLDSHPEELRKITADKISFNLTGLELRQSSPRFVKDIINKLEEAFHKNKVTAHMFGGLTQKSKSFKIHRDPMDVFYLQVLGEIEWSVWEPKNAYWSHKEGRENMLSKEGNRIFTERLTTGKMIWIPRGTYHLVNPYSSRLGISFGVEHEPNPSIYI